MSSPRCGTRRSRRIRLRSPTPSPPLSHKGTSREETPPKGEHYLYNQADTRAVCAAWAVDGLWAWANSLPRPTWTTRPVLYSSASLSSGPACVGSCPPVLAPAPESPLARPSSHSVSVSCSRVPSPPCCRSPSVALPRGRSPSQVAPPSQEMDQGFDPSPQDMDQGCTPPHAESIHTPPPAESIHTPPPAVKPGPNTPLGSATRLGRNAGRSPTHILVSFPLSTQV